MAHNDTKYSVNARLIDLASRVLALETENKVLRSQLITELKTYVNDQVNVISDSIRVPLDGRDGRDGVDGAPGPQGEKGERGDITVYSSEELAAAVKEMRLKLAQKHAAAIAPLVRRIEHEKKNESAIHVHFSRLLEGILAEVEALSR